MKAGRALDALIETRLFGHEVELRYCESDMDYKGWLEAQAHEEECGHNIADLLTKGYGEMQPCYVRYKRESHTRWDVVAEYSIDIAAAWRVVEHFKQPLWVSDVYQAMSGTYSVSIRKWQNECVLGDGATGDASSNSAPHAICLAALKAVGAKEQ